MTPEEEKNLPEEPVEVPEEAPVADPEGQEEPEQRYFPRPKWQIVAAWVLLAAVIAAVGCYYYWIMYKY